MKGSISIQIDKLQYKASRLAWFLMTGAWPVVLIDHKDRNGFNNRWSNLREATYKQNGENRKLDVRSTSGVTGVNWHEHSGKWIARIGHKGKRVILGGFAKKADAVKARREAERQLYTHA